MRASGHTFDLLSHEEEDRLHAAALRILEEMGMEVGAPELLRELGERGLAVDVASQRVRFPRVEVERFLGESDKAPHNAPPVLSASAGVYESRYHDPASNTHVGWTEQRLSDYFALARALPQIGGAHMLGCRVAVPPELEPLYERYYSWKLGAAEGGSVWRTELCPALLDLYQARAAALQCPVSKVFRASVYLMPMLKLGRHEAEQVLFFRRHGLAVHIGGGMGAMGAGLPVTHAGAVALNLAEQLALALVDRALNGGRRFTLGGSISVLDLRTAIRPFGRPEMTITSLMMAQMARRYGAQFSGHGGLSDAKLPSAEAGAQKALTALPTLMAGGDLWMDAGLLSIDEICSPIQLVLDNELLAALQRFTTEFAVTEESIGLDTILSAGPGGSYLDTEHTVSLFRTEHWQPSIWSRQMLPQWLAAGAHLDSDRARDSIPDSVRAAAPIDPLPEQLDRELLSIIEAARHIRRG